MELRRHLGNDWRNAIWKIVRNPAFEVLATILAVLFATWILVSTEVDQKNDHKKTSFPVPFSHNGHR